MKLHKVLISNLNSLYGEHSIDFDQDLKRAPLFLIMGPTGAGKSTILDAICVALFGRTPRLTRAVGKPDQDARHLMSYGTGRCRAEVVFSLKDAEGERHTWRAVWECRRARDKASGNLQDATRSLYKVIDEETEELIVSDNRLKYFEPHFESVLGGMTVEDFQRSILLAQGEFAAFLKADEQVKASILERLTSTDEYKLIGQRAAKKRREVENRLKELGARLDGLSLLTPQEESELRERVAEQEAVVEATRKDAQQARSARDWIQRYDHFQEVIAASTAQRQLAEKKIESHAEELQALSEDQRCRDAQPILIRARDLAQRLIELEALTPELEQSKLDKVQELETQTTIAQDSQSKLDAQRAALDVLKPEINRARELHQRIALNQRELDRVTQSANQLSDEVESTRAAHTEATANLTTLTHENQTNLSAIEALEWSDAQRAALPAFSTSLIQLRDARQALDERLLQHQASTTRLEGAKTSHAETSRALEVAREAISPQRNTLDKAQASLSAFLGESETPERFRQRVQLAQKASDTLIDALDQALSIHETLVERREAQAELVRQHTSIERTIKAHASKIEELTARRNASRQEIAQEQESIARQKHILVLFEHRHTLQEDHACPLCGSEEHPYLRDNATDKKAEESALVEFEQTRAKLEALQRREEETARELHEVELQLASDEATFKHIEKRKQELRQETQTLLARYNKALEAAALATIETFPGKPKDQSDQRDAIVETRIRIKLDSERGEQQIQELDTLLAQRQEAEKELESVATQVRELETKLTRIESEITLREEDQQTRAQDLAEAQNRHRTQYEHLSTHLDALAPQMLMTGLAPGIDDLEKALATFQAREKERRDLETEQTRLASAMRDAQTLIARQHERLERLNTSKKELDEDIASRQKELEEARQEQSTLLEGKNPDEVERTHERQIKQTDATLKMALNLQAQARNDFERARTLHEAHENQLKEHRQRTAEAQKQLTETLAKLELESAEALSERLLLPERRSELEELHDALHRELENHRRDLERYNADLAKHTTQKPEIEELFEHELDAWSDTTRKLEQELEEHIADLGAVNEKLETQQEAKRRAAEYKEELEALREESNIWEVIYRLIGIKDGGSFKHFAQTLNLQELVDRANVRLKRLAPRYQLAVASGEQGEPRLDFSIRDHHQADTERPLTTLSGGETFLVSLALALALSDFRRVEMPVETLLLDEGFGTLDQETLDLAMATLRQLQQENVQQIGIISHVEGLKERVDTRIVVEKIGNGRSVIKIDAA